MFTVSLISFDLRVTGRQLTFLGVLYPYILLYSEDFGLHYGGCLLKDVITEMLHVVPFVSSFISS